MNLIDISPRITSSLAVFPGDTSAAREVLMDMKAGANITLSTLRSTVHLGAHADAPSHYGRDGRTIDAQSLELYFGRCQVIAIPAKPRQRITRGDIPRAVTAERVLLRTGTFPDPERWTSDFAALDPGLIDELHDDGVRLIGVDTPSVDLADDKQLIAHARFLANDMAILEGIVLDGVADGIYELIALPLSLVGFDASPVCAVLRRM